MVRNNNTDDARLTRSTDTAGLTLITTNDLSRETIIIIYYRTYLCGCIIIVVIIIITTIVWPALRDVAFSM